MQYRGSADHVTPFPHQGCQWQAGRNRTKEANKERWVAFHFSPRVSLFCFHAVFLCYWCVVFSAYLKIKTAGYSNGKMCSALSSQKYFFCKL